MTTLTITEARLLGRVIDAADREVPVTWLTDSGQTITGVIRGLFPAQGQDVRDAQVRVSGTFEHLFTMAEVMAKVADGTMALDFRP